MSYKNLIYETDDRIGIIKINRPEVRTCFRPFGKESHVSCLSALSERSIVEGFGDLWRSLQDKRFKEGVTAFLEKRKPVFRNE